MISVLYIDDERDLLDLGKLFLEREGLFKVATASSGEEGISLLSKNNYDVILCDYHMPKMDGIELLKYTRKNISADIPFILFTGRSREAVVIEALNNGATAYVQKGGEVDSQFAELASKIVLVADRMRDKRTNESSRELSTEIIEQEELRLEPFLPKLVKILGADGAFIAFRYDNELRVKAILGNNKKDIENMVVPCGCGLGWEVIRLNTAIATNDYVNNRDLAHDGEVDRIISEEEIYSAMAAPVSSKYKNYGILYLFTRKERFFTKEDLDLLYHHANFMAIATEKDEMRVELEKREKDLIGTNKKLTLVSGIARHSINNYLTVIIGFVSMMLEMVNDKKLYGFLLKVEEATQKIRRELENARIYQEVGINNPQWCSSDEIIDDCSKGYPDIKVINHAKGWYVFADPLLKMVMENFFDNTQRHSGKENPVVTLGYENCPNGDAILSYEDDGVGIPSEGKEKIFERGFGSNTGLGLFLSREILSVTNMKIRETGEPGKGVRFEVMIPKGYHCLQK
jgi:CheY-like chemotaxis protein/signal transduction histidine kinase